MAYYDAVANAFKEAASQYKGRFSLVDMLKDVARYGRNLLLHAATSVKENPNFSDIAQEIDRVANLHKSNPPINVTYLKDLSWNKHFSDEFNIRLGTISAHAGMAAASSFEAKPVPLPELIQCQNKLPNFH